MQKEEYLIKNACYSVTKYYLCKRNNKRSLSGRKQRLEVVRSFPNRYQFSCINKVTSLFSNRYIFIIIFRSIILCDLLLYIDVTFWYLSIDLGLFWGSWFLHRHKIPHPNPMGDMISTKKYCLFKEYFRVVCFICI